MDCNREEAIRAKQLAEKKMEIKDFYGALKIAIKAQQLYSELENISQMIAVCEVHCSAEKKSYGTDKDWYGILKLEPSADELSIKKQYRKLALVLHPDKNKFSGSTDAFKLIGEAQRVLLDREKRAIHDSKRRAFGNVSAPKWAPNQPSRPSNIHQPVNFNGVRPGPGNFSYTHRPVPHQRAPHQWETTGVGSNQLTFWTVCAFCSVRYQFYRDVLNKVINCQSCKKSFTAFELNAQGGTTAAAPSTTQTQTSYSQQNKVPPNHRYTAKPVFEKKEPPKARKNLNNKRKKRIEESSESSDSSESSESEEEDVEKHIKGNKNGVSKNGDMDPNNPDSPYFGEQPRRSSRAKRNVSYKEKHVDIDNDDSTPSKQAKREEDEMEESDSEKPQQNDKGPRESKLNDNVEETANDDDSEEEIEPEVFECPDPEFSDFEKDRKETSFAVGQIWACYDTEDAMPRFYAYIKKVASSGFKLQIQWLKPDPVSPDEKKWVQEGLPVSCGGYKREKNDKAEDLLSFSHLVTWETGQKAGTFNITPKNGQTWALFRDWSIMWDSSTENDEERKYEYEFVEILSDYDENAGVRVAYLEKVKGFVCLFNRKVGGEIIIPASDKYKFAHMVPSCRMGGTEREGVPKGSYELDPAGLPSSTFEKVNL
ncbi:uncharacterized protein [Rutidosis leptorrhynchoides]|uniref:uncharacterized protein n=1 Tax=Rutidosis leptorrhynchoides TaxID=125765 RepID=UPI003A99D16B